MSIWRKQGGVIGKQSGNDYPSSGLWDVTETYTDSNVPAIGEVLFSTVQTNYSWTVPDGATSVSIICVGGGGSGAASTSSSNGVSGGGGGGGGLHWINSVSATPGETLTINIGAGGAGGSASGQNDNTSGLPSNVSRGGTLLAQATGGALGAYNLSTATDQALGGIPSTGLGGGGGNGGPGRGGASGNGGSGGGGAGGYSGAGGRGGWYLSSYTPADGAGGGGGGGGAVNGFTGTITTGGGGVNVYGEGTSGSEASANNTGSQTTTRGFQGSPVGTSAATGVYGGGGTGAEDDSPGAGGTGSAGVVRIIWGAGRSFPSTNTDEASSNGNVTTV